MTNSARGAILAAVRRATEGTRDEDAAAAHASIERAYRTSSEESVAGLLDRLEERLVDYGVHVLRVDHATLPDVLRSEAQRRKFVTIVVPDGLPETYLTAFDGCTRIPGNASARELGGADAAITTCAVAVAETGTIALGTGPGQGRRAVTLVPDVHLCIVAASRVVALLPEAVARLGDAVASGAPITWISGPSATSDIELVRVAGVHGPRTLIVALVEDR